MTLRLALLLAVFAGPACALTLDFPTNARRVASVETAMSSYDLPISGYANGALETFRAEGAVTQQVWQMQASGQTTLQILVPLRQQLTDLGFEILFECDAQSCGGFDFRYAMEVLPEPDMHVDLGDFRFAGFRRIDEGGPEHISLLVSRSVTQGYVQLTRVGPFLPQDPVVVTSSKGPLVKDAVQVAPVLAPVLAPAAQPPQQGDLIATLEAKGRAVLDDLAFQTGSSSLEDADFKSLEALAAYLKANPTRAIVLVGHTDAEGSLAGNIALSKRRAGSVRAQLTGALGVPASQVAADGVGFLSPLASNLTEEGRTANRRVEVILSVTQ